MNKFIKTFLWFLLFLTMIAICYIIVKTVLMFLNGKKAMGITWFNTYQCDKKICPAPEEILNNPPQAPNIVNPYIWEKNVAQFSAYLVYTLEVAGQTGVAPIYPDGLTLLKNIYNDSEDPIFGAILTNDNLIWIALRGTLSSSEWAQDLQYQQEAFLNSKSHEQVKLKFFDDINLVQPAVHKGFVSVYEKFRDEIFDILQQNDKYKNKTIIVTGHSLGAGISTIMGADLINSGYKQTVVYNFASPRVGDTVFSDFIENQLKMPLYRIVNTADLIPTMPPSVAPNFKDPENPYEYIHCGKLKTFSLNWKSTLNNHLIGVYLKGLENIQ